MYIWGIIRMYVDFEAKGLNENLAGWTSTGTQKLWRPVFNPKSCYNYAYVSRIWVPMDFS